MNEHLLVVLCNVAAGQEDEFNLWYTHEHMVDVLEKLDGFVTAQRYELAPTQREETTYRYAAIYRIPADQLDAAQAAILMQYAERAEALAAGRTPLLTMSDSFAEPNGSWYYSPISPLIESSTHAEPLDQDSAHVMFVFSNVKDGEEQEFNRWYTDEHVVDVVDKLDGYLSAQRYELAGGQLGDAPFRYLALYNIAADKLETSFQANLAQREERKEALAAGRRPMLTTSTTMVAPHHTWWYSPITAELTSTRNAQ